MRLCILIFAVVGCLSVSLLADEYKINGHTFTVPSGIIVEQIAGPPLVNRPVSADFDEQGRLYVTDSSGSNEHVDVQRKKRPHRIMRLVDTNGDGKFDKSTVYADKLMFPEGALWLNGSLYVSAPPEIWKFTDADDDGVAEKREVWFDGKTLTHCANDLHGPYLGPDGWMYWCKGAFAEQTYDRPEQKTLVTKAAHIFRRRPEGGPIDIVMTGGMDNPVEIAFSPGGERFFTTTFLVHPNQGNRDGMIHAVYGGVYGKDHGVLNGHPRTGDLMPNLVHMGAAAPCGLTQLETDGLGEGFRANILASLFNMHKITRNVMKREGATFRAESTDLLVSDNVDFHPTDVLEDADGSVIVVDTGGWFRLCCPTSQLEKPDVLGGIYRLRRAGAEKPTDPRGIKIAWDNLPPEKLASLLTDDRFTVRIQARRRLVRAGVAAVPALESLLAAKHADDRLQAVWALTGIQHPSARELVRRALGDSDEVVRHAALHSVSLHRDKAARAELSRLVSQGPPHVRRVAAEAIGRIGDKSQTQKLLELLPDAVLPDGRVDRFLEHSLIYAALEMGDVATLRRSLASTQPRTVRGALIALQQIDTGRHLKPGDIQSYLVSNDPVLRDVAWWIAEKHPQWNAAVAEALQHQLKDPTQNEQELQELGKRLSKFAGSKAVQEMMASALTENDARPAVRTMVMRAMSESKRKPMPASWDAPLYQQLSSKSPVMANAAMVAYGSIAGGKFVDRTEKHLQEMTRDRELKPELRLRALALLPASKRNNGSAMMEFVCSQLNVNGAITNRALAVDVLSSTPLDDQQLQRVAQQLPSVGSMELRPLLALFAKSKDKEVGNELVSALAKAPAATSLLPDRVTELVKPFGSEVAAAAKPLLQRIEKENQSKLQRVEEILALLPKADIRRGIKVFKSSKASCIACHRRGYLGGQIGPDLNRIGSVRSERDLVESILFPSLSFVRSYEPVSLALDNGKIVNGLVRDENDESITVQIDAQKQVVIPKSSVEQRKMGSVSIMPAGLEKQLSPQDLADLVKYLKEG